jgi:hypothetical protein
MSGKAKCFELAECFAAHPNSKARLTLTYMLADMHSCLCGQDLAFYNIIPAVYPLHSKKARKPLWRAALMSVCIPAKLSTCSHLVSILQQYMQQSVRVKLYATASKYYASQGLWSLITNYGASIARAYSMSAIADQNVKRAAPCARRFSRPSSSCTTTLGPSPHTTLPGSTTTAW